MTKQTWRTKKLRSADTRRSAHQRAAKSARKIRGERRKAIDLTAAKIEETLEAWSKSKKQKYTVSLDKAPEQKVCSSHTTSLWGRICASLLGATIFSFFIFGISFIIFGADQAAKGSSYFPTSDFVTTIGAALVAWLVTFAVIWYCWED